MPTSLFRQLPALITHRPLRRVVLGLAIIFLLYSLCGFFILPRIIQWQTETLIAEKLRRQASFGAVEFNPFTLALTLRDFEMHEAKGGKVFASFDALHINLSSESLLRLAPVIREARLTGPHLRLVRTAPHRYNVDDILEFVSSQPPSDEPARFAVNNIQIDGGRVEFDDRPAKAVHAVTDIALGIPFLSSLPSQVDIFVEPLLSAKVNGSPMAFKGKARPFAEPAEATVELKLDGLDLTRYLGYLPLRPQVQVTGAKLDLNLTARFRQGGGAPALLLHGDAAVKSVHVEDLAGKPVLRWKELVVQLQEADVFGARASISKMVLDGLQADASRDANGRFSLDRLMPSDETTGSASAPKESAAPRGFRLDVGEFAIRNASLRYADAQLVQPMRASVDKLHAAVRKVALDTGKRTLDIGELASREAAFFINRAERSTKAVSAAPGKATALQAPEAAERSEYAISIANTDIGNWSVRVEDHGGREPVVTTASPVSLSMQGISNAPSSRARVDLKAHVNQSGQVAVNGTVGLAPLHADLALDIKAVDILPLQPFVTDRFNLRATRAHLSASGRVRADIATDGGLQGGFKGDAALGNLATVDKAGGNDFLRWKSLQASGMDIRFAPFAVAVDQVALSDFFARIIIDPTGRINLQDIVRGESETPAAETLAAAKVAPASGRAEGARMPPITVKRVSLQGGRVRFTDNFIRPNYSASLSQFGGVLSGLSSDPESRGEVDLRGEVNGAPLNVGGRINPLRGDLFLDIKANVRGMELAPLSAYSGKYVGYGIEKGKLSFEAGYHIDQRKLTADNRLILEQLTFGDKVDSPDAANLPVQFAVALLSDRNGVIDINLPIAGSLDDPQFSIGGIIVRLIGNTIAKAVTQPFALLGALFGGGAELSSMAFEPGRAAVPASGEEKLRALAKALADRPGLKLDIAGRADPEADREGLKHALIERKVRALKIRDLRARGDSVEPGSVTVSREEYPALLLRAYRDETFPKPRNVLGLPKDLPVGEMEKLMIAHVEVDEDDLLALASQRAQAVKSWLQKQGQVAPERMFIVASKVGGASKEPGAAPSRVDFSLK